MKKYKRRHREGEKALGRKKDFERGIKTVEQRSDGGVCGELGGRGEGEGVHGVVRYFE